jgi:hypothetical protein
MTEGVSLNPADRNWDKELEKNGSFLLPDCRVKPLERERFQFKIGRLVLDQVFCASCHKPWGGVTPNVTHIFYICDDCVRMNGPPPDCVQVPET